MDESDLTSSHDLKGNPNADAPPEMQNRDYNPAIVLDGAQKLKPHELLDKGAVGETGRPVVTRWNGRLLVLSGNHRVNMIRQAMREFQKNGARYTEVLKRAAQDFGIDPSEVDGRKILVREIEPPKSLEEMKQLVADLNERRTQSFNKNTDMANRAANVTPYAMELVSAFMERQGGAGTLKSMLDTADGEVLMRQLVKDGVLPHTELPTFVENGKLTPIGKQAVEGAITGRLLGGARAQPGILNKLVTAAGTIARAEAAAPDFKLAEKIQQAVRLIAEAGDKSVDEFVNQGKLGDARIIPAMDVIALAKDLKKLGPKVFTEWLKTQVDELAKPTDIFSGKERVTKYQARPAKRTLKSKPGSAEVRDQETGEWRPYDPAKDGPAPTMKDSASAEYSDETLAGDGAKQGWMSPQLRERVTETKKTPPPRDPTYNQIPPDNGWSEYVREFTSEEHITPDDTKPHEVHTAPLAETTDGYPRRTGLTSLLAESGISAEDMKAKDIEQMGGAEMIDRLENLIESHPGAELTLSKVVRKAPLTAAEKLVFDKAPAEFEKLGREFRNFLDMVRAHDIPLREKAEALKAQADALEPGDAKAAELRAEAESLENQRYAIGDLGPNYFPWRNLTWESVWKMAKRYGVEGAYERIKKGNLDYSREGVNEPMSNSVETLKSYVQQVRTKMTEIQAAQKIKAAGELAKARGWITAEKIFKDFYESHIKRVSSMMDQAEFVKRLERMDRDPAYRAKFKDTVAMRSPVSEIVGWHNSVVSAMTVAFNLSSGLTAGVGNTWRVASEMGLKRFAKAAGKTLDYAASKAASKFSGVKLDPKMKALEEQVQRMAGLEDAELADITGQESGYELGGKLFSRVRKAAYQHVRIPDVIAKFIAVIDQLEAVKEENPSWSPRRVETEAAIRVAGMTDVSKGWSRAPVANNPIYKAMMLFSKSAVRETTQMLRQLNGGPSGWSKLAINLGGRAATWALVYKLTSGQVDRDRVMQALARILPFSYLWENKAPPIGVIPQKIYKAATGEPEALLPSAVQQKGLRRLFKKEK